MKTIKISDEAHRKLTATLGALMAQSGKTQTYQDVITALLTQSVKLPTEIIAEVENFIKENKHLGYTTKEEFIREAIRFKLNMLRDGYKYIEIPKDKNEKLSIALKEMNTPYNNAKEFIQKQIEGLLEQFEGSSKEK
jgi:CRISPR/Cas system CSM-associated protein Csm2 small subunit